jgi:hypothetical protein
MYSYGSSARATGKSGHGGRNYRPPPERKDTSCTPPPLKECSCLIILDIAEYQNLQPMGRLHTIFGGRETMQHCETFVRSEFTVHLIIPGRKQAGSVAIAAQTYRQALPAVAWLLQRFQGVDSVTGRIQTNVKNVQDPGVSGIWTRQPSNTADRKPYWLFQSETWSVLGCPLVVLENDNEKSSRISMLALLQTCVDNAKFHLGSGVVNQVHVFTDNQACNTAFGAGNHQQALVLYKEVQKALVDAQNDQEQKTS